jgi:hypothetical protein
VAAGAFEAVVGKLLAGNEPPGLIGPHVLGRGRHCARQNSQYDG